MTETSLTTLSDFVQIKDEQVYTTSRIVAEKFGKRHDNVIRDIEATISTINEAQVIENKDFLKIEEIKNDYFIDDINGSQPIENINGLKNQPVKNYYFIDDINGSQPIENINQPKFGLVKNDYFIADDYLDAKGETRKQYLITEEGAMLLIMGFTGEKAFSVKLKFISEFKRMKEYIRTLEANPIERILANSTNQLETARAITQMLEIEAKKQEVLIAQNKLKTLLTLKIRSVKPSLITASDAEQANNGINRSIRQVQTDNRANATKQISQSGFTPKQTQNFLSKLFHCLFSQPSCLIR